MKRRKSKLDRLSTLVTNRFKFFKKGIGDKKFIEDLSLNKLPVPKLPEIEWGKERNFAGTKIITGKFESPYSVHLPEEVKTVYLQKIIPKNHTKDDPIAIHFAMTGDQGFYKRLITMGIPLSRKNIATVIIENPYYGKRKPSGQFGVFLNTLSDFFKMNAASVQEGRALVEYLHRQGYTKIGVTGVSMGGGVSAFVAALSKFEIAAIPCIGPNSPEDPFLEGFLKGSVAWNKIQKELGTEISAKQYFRSLMYKSDVRKLTPPKRPDLAWIVGGEMDGVVPPVAVKKLHDHWKGSHLTWIRSGHIGSMFFHNKRFRQTIIDVFQNWK